MIPNQKQIQVQDNLKTHITLPATINFKGLQPVRMGEAVIDVTENILHIGPYKFHLTPDRDNKKVETPPELSRSGLVTPSGMSVKAQNVLNDSPTPIIEEK